ncbi:cell death abnormality protein 1-like [Littorina saxatilis]|uniref:cell death abnormality protein 1-like n=1 Tax=Littorina saxatilis TaxID=31220 RepID=UPI0038B5A53D
MSGIHVEVDNQTCYTFPLADDNGTALDALPEKIDVTCTPPLTGREVRLQKRGQRSSSIFGPYMINVCEVQVWACTDGLFGEQCDQTCSGHCKDNDTCDNYYGTCPAGCSTGSRGGDCRCGHCRGDADCDVTTLRCPSGCDKGWDTEFCNQSCPAGTHGYGCRERCGQCADSDTCNTVTGLCPNGCQPGWQGDNCKQRCADGYYGQRCMSRCGDCSDGEVCDKVNGTCPTGCQPGFNPFDRLCKTACPLMRYGAECAHRCGQCQNNACDVVTGHCDACQPKLLHPLCQVCAGKMYGAECDTPCSVQCGGDGSCHRNNGRCQAGCASGYLLGSGFCDEKTSESSPNLAGPVAGGVFGGLCVITLSILLVGLLIRRSRRRSSSETASPRQASADQNFESGAPVGLNGQVTPPEEIGSAGVGDAEESHIYDELQTPDESDRAPPRLIRRSRKSSSSETASPSQASADQSLRANDPVELSNQVTLRVGAPGGLNRQAALQEETGSAGGTEAEENHYEGLQTPDDSDRDPYSTPKFKGKQANARNSHTYQNSALHTNDIGNDYYNL